MQAFKRIGLVLGALLVLALGGIAIVASQFDAPRIKAELARVVQEKKQRTLKIDGALELSLWPTLGVRLGRVSLSERGSAEVFAAVESMRVAVAVMPLLSRQIVVDTVDVGGVQATLIRRKDGTLNIDDLFAKDEAPSQPLRLDIAGVRLADLKLNWRDEKAGSATAISGIDLTTGRIQADTGRKTVQVDALALAVKGKAAADSFDIRLELPQLVVAPEGTGAAAATVTAVLAGARRNGNAKLVLAGIDAGARALRIDKLSLAVDAKAGALSLRGTLDTALAADFAGSSVALDKFAGTFDLAHPQLPLQRLKLALNGGLRADLARQSAHGHLATRFDESRIALKFDVDSFAPLAVGFDLDIDRLNVDKYLPPRQPGAAEKKDGDGKLDFAAFKNLRLNGSVRIGSLQVARVQASNVRLQVRAADGKLDIGAIRSVAQGSDGAMPSESKSPMSFKVE